VIIVDVNLLIYAKISGLEEHEAANTWLDDRLNGPAGVALPWSTLLGFARIVSNPRVFSKPLTISAAWRQVQEWRSCPAVYCPEPTHRHGAILERLVPDAVTRSNLLPDAHLAALAIEYGLTLHSTDGDFARFEGLSWVNPLAGG